MNLISGCACGFFGRAISLFAKISVTKGEVLVGSYKIGGDFPLIDCHGGI